MRVGNAIVEWAKLVTTEALIAEKPEKNPPTPAGGGGGMGEWAAAWAGCTNTPACAGHPTSNQKGRGSQEPRLFASGVKWLYRKKSDAFQTKKEIYLWDDESGEPAPFTPEEVKERLEAANDRAEQEDAEEAARFKELDDLLTREEALAEKLHTTLQESISEMNRINARVAALTPTGRKTVRSKRSRSISATPASLLP